MKLAAAKSGGVFVDQGVESHQHTHHLFAIIISLASNFEIIDVHGSVKQTSAVLVRKDTPYSVRTNKNDVTLFAHIDPYSNLGFKLFHLSIDINHLSASVLAKCRQKIDAWLTIENPNIKETELLLEYLVECVSGLEIDRRPIDPRIRSAIELIGQSDLESLSLSSIASQVSLSGSRFSHLFRQETGLSLRKFLQNRKLIRSLKTLHTEPKLGSSAFDGGFTDQSHFIKTFKENFGIKPSQSKK